MVQGGDVLYNNGFGTTSIYGKTFVDEHFGIEFDRPGLLGMANTGPDSNGCQFFITTAPAPHLNGKHVAFGQVVVGFDLVKEIESLGSPEGRPRAQIWVTDSGELNEAGFLAEVQYERARIEERIEKEKAIDLEELRIYNECVRSGIEYVPRALRERIRREQADRERIQEIEDYSEQILKNSLDAQVQKLATLQEEIQTTRTRANVPKHKEVITKELLKAVKASKTGARTLVESLEDARRDAGILGKSDLAKFTEKLLKRAPTSFTTYMDRFDNLLEYSAHTPAPLTADVIIRRLATMKQRASQSEDENLVAPAQTAKETIDQIQTQLASEYLQTLKIIERHPKTHRLSPRITPTQAAQLDKICDELEQLKPYDSPSTDFYTPPSSGGLDHKSRAEQIEALAAQKSSLEQMLHPYTSSGIRLPFNPTSASLKPETRRRAYKKPTKS